MTRLTPSDRMDPFGRVLMIEKEPDVRQIGSVVLPENIADRGTVGVIVKAGEDCPVEFTPGRRVVYKPFSGVATMIDKTEFLLLSPEDVLCFLEAGDEGPKTVFDLAEP